MNQLALYITLLLVHAYCVHGDPSSTAGSLTQARDKRAAQSSHTSEKSCPAWEEKDDLLDASQQHGDHNRDAGVLMSKPKLVVTFLANSRALDRMDGNELGGAGGGGGGMEPPFFLDPLQRLLQFFFSSFARDLSPRFGKDDEEAAGGPSAGGASVGGAKENATDLQWLAERKEDPSRMYCDHGADGFCRSCHVQARMLDAEPFGKAKREMTTMSRRDFPLLRFNISSLLTTEAHAANATRADNSSAIATPTTGATIGGGNSSAASTAAPTTTTRHPSSRRGKNLVNVKHKRHYFLSISGDTDQRVAAPESSEYQHARSRSKRNASAADAASGRRDNPSLFKILEETIYESLNKDRDVQRKQQEEATTTAAGTEASAKTAEDETTGHAPTTPEQDPGVADDDADDDDFFEFGITPHLAEYSRGWTYFFLVTLPVTCTFLVVMIFLCVFLRTRGWCCRLFLKDPSKTLQEYNAKVKHKTAAKKTDQIADA